MFHTTCFSYLRRVVLKHLHSCFQTANFTLLIHFCLQQTFERAREDIKAALTVLNAYLLPRTYLVGERVTLADISVACTLLNLYKEVLDPNFRKPFVNVNRWFSTLVNQPQFKAVLGEVKLCDKVAEVDPKKFAQQQQGGEQFFLFFTVAQHSQKTEYVVLFYETHTHCRKL